AANQPGQSRAAQRLEPARDDTRPQYLPGRHRRGDALYPDGPEIAVLEEIADQPARACGDDDRIGLGQGLQPGGEVRRFANHRLLLRRSFANQIADDYQTGSNADARLQRRRFVTETTDRVDHAQPGANRTL